MARAHTRHSNLGQGTAAAWVTVTVMASVTQCNCSDAGAVGGGSNRGGDKNWWQHWEKVIMALVTRQEGSDGPPQPLLVEWRLGKARESSAGISQGTSGTGLSIGAALGCGTGSHAAF